MDQRVQKIQQMMRDNLNNELSLRELAQSVNLSVWRLSHVFTTETGMSPIQYLKLLRMERAKHLLETSFLSVKEISFSVGINDESHFARDFKKVYGVSPTLHRLGASDHQKKTGNGTGGLKAVGRASAKTVTLCLAFTEYLFHFFSFVDRVI